METMIDCGKRVIFDKLNDVYAKYYTPTERLAIVEIIVLFKGRSIFIQFIPKKYKWFVIKTHKLCDFKGYMCNIILYLGSDRRHVTSTMVATHATVTGFNCKD